MLSVVFTLFLALAQVLFVMAQGFVLLWTRMYESFAAPSLLFCSRRARMESRLFQRVPKEDVSTWSQLQRINK